MTKDVRFGRFIRDVVYPYWAFNPPMFRTPEGFGIYTFAQKGEVGKFNLSWLTLPQGCDPHSKATYEQAPLRWAIMVAPQVVVSGRPLIEHASFKTLPEFRELILPKRAMLEHKLVGGGMTWDQLARALRSESVDQEGS